MFNRVVMKVTEEEGIVCVAFPKPEAITSGIDQVKIQFTPSRLLITMVKDKTNFPHGAFCKPLTNFQDGFNKANRAYQDLWDETIGIITIDSMGWSSDKIVVAQFLRDVLNVFYKHFPISERSMRELLGKLERPGMVAIGKPSLTQFSFMAQGGGANVEVVESECCSSVCAVL